MKERKEGTLQVAEDLKNELYTIDLENEALLLDLQRRLSCNHADLASLAAYYRSERERQPELRTQAVAKKTAELYGGDEIKSITLAEKLARSEVSIDKSAASVGEWEEVKHWLKTTEGMMTTVAAALRSIDTSKRYMSR